MPSVRQSKADLRRHLAESLQFIRASAASFDEGFTGEAKRLAAAIRLLVHDTAKSKPLLGLLGYKTGLGFLNTSHPYDARQLGGHHGLVGIRIVTGGGGGTGYYAHLADRASPETRYVMFPDWWTAWREPRKRKQ
jgi:hypothetical protein